MAEQDASIVKAVNRIDAVLAHGSIGGALRYMNEPANILRDHQFYRRILHIGSGAEQPAAELDADWYKRNFLICARLIQLARPGDRITSVRATLIFCASASAKRRASAWSNPIHTFPDEGLPVPDIMHLLFKAPVEDVLAALTTPERIREWWTPDADIESRVGEFRFHGGASVHRITILEHDLPRRALWNEQLEVKQDA
jgi:uncharacterized protein DUF5694/activator of Hsp90 ATPase-like protein